MHLWMSPMAFATVLPTSRSPSTRPPGTPASRPSAPPPICFQPHIHTRPARHRLDFILIRSILLVVAGVSISSSSFPASSLPFKESNIRSSGGHHHRRAPSTQLEHHRRAPRTWEHHPRPVPWPHARQPHGQQAARWGCGVQQHVLVVDGSSGSETTRAAGGRQSLILLRLHQHLQWSTSRRRRRRWTAPPVRPRRPEARTH